MIKHVEIRRRRLAMGISLRMFARMLNISAAYLSSIELGQSTPSIPVLSAIANALGCSLDDLVDTKNPIPPVRRRQNR